MNYLETSISYNNEKNIYSKNIDSLIFALGSNCVARNFIMGGGGLTSHIAYIDS